jgi:hypothetical protein
MLFRDQLEQIKKIVLLQIREDAAKTFFLWLVFITNIPISCQKPAKPKQRTRGSEEIGLRITRLARSNIY